MAHQPEHKHEDDVLSASLMSIKLTTKESEYKNPSVEKASGAMSGDEQDSGPEQSKVKTTDDMISREEGGERVIQVKTDTGKQ